MTKNQNQSQKNNISIWWIKNDLRLNFNESLNAANINPELILPIYIYNENDLNNQSDFDSEKLIRLNKEYAELKPIVDTINNFNKHKKRY